jgi:DNA (cytosine-5)-methyltransferase 1
MMRAGTIFSGIGAPECAAPGIDWRWAAEIDPFASAVAIAFGGNNTAGPIDVATACNAHGGPHGRCDFESETFVAHSLRADGFDASEDGTGRGTPLIATGFYQNMGSHGGGAYEDASPTLKSDTHAGNIPAVAHLDVPHRGKPAADGPRYRAVGNSMAVPVIGWVLSRVQQIAAASLEEAA